jgi:hypothetical protein
MAFIKECIIMIYYKEHLDLWGLNGKKELILLVVYCMDALQSVSEPFPLICLKTGVPMRTLL